MRGHHDWPCYIAKALIQADYYREASVYECFPFTWAYNAQPVLLKNSTRSQPQGRNGDFSSKWTVIDFNIFESVGWLLFLYFRDRVSSSRGR
jgi:hypothetical protein